MPVYGPLDAGPGLAGPVVPAWLLRPAQDAVLDRRRPLPGHGGDHHVPDGVHDHQRHRHSLEVDPSGRRGHVLRKVAAGQVCDDAWRTLVVSFILHFSLSSHPSWTSLTSQDASDD